MYDIYKKEYLGLRKDWGKTPIPKKAFLNIFRFFEGREIIVIDKASIGELTIEGNAVITNEEFIEKGLYDEYVKYMKEDKGD